MSVRFAVDSRSHVIDRANTMSRLRGSTFAVDLSMALAPYNAVHHDPSGYTWVTTDKSRTEVAAFFSRFPFMDWFFEDEEE